MQYLQDPAGGVCLYYNINSSTVPMSVRIHVTAAEQADAVWRLLITADDDLFPVELHQGGQLLWTATRSEGRLLTTLAPDPRGHSCPGSDPAVP